MTRNSPTTAPQSPDPAELARLETEQFLDWLAQRPNLTPKQMFRKLGAAGYVGQDRARKAVCLMAFRHLRRIRMIYLEGIPRAQLPPKSNILLMGPTGCGKTFLVDTLFNKILQIPAVLVDVSCLTETGYIGQDASSVITRLISAASRSILRASVGIICIDEFDKLAGSTSNHRFGGAGTSKDVSGFGVQKELLAMLESSDVIIPLDYANNGYSQRSEFNTADVPFVACGAFSGFDGAREETRYSKSDLGFRQAEEKASAPLDKPDQPMTTNRDIAQFETYGFMPELIGRFNRIVRFDELGQEELKEILRRDVIAQYRKELEWEGIDLRITRSVYDLVVRQCLNCGTGARGLRSSLNQHVEDACFEAYSNPTVGGRQIELHVRNGHIVSHLGV